MSGPIVSNPRYERLAVNLFAGMTCKDAMMDAGFAESYALSATPLIESKIIQDRVRELQETHAQKLLNTSAVATKEERKQRLSSILRHSIEQPVSAGHQIAAAKELNLMDGVYKLGETQVQPVISVTYVFNQVEAPKAQKPVIEIAERAGIDKKEDDVSTQRTDGYVTGMDKRANDDS